ncbi:unnamed protein product [Pseudo-nitzschia multistriata]|uniref:Uncharacterized protein n=1 Tax=Pseudo-nitzschia multistriata TaxID=183589 RepID=A0A448Z4V5_9STRA|nr:unnamed protein product [Pseudo-nitzschia multistriata]
MASKAFKNLPPEVRRELLRHVKPPPSASTSFSQQSADHLRRKHKRLEAVGGQRSKSAQYWLMGCVGFVGAAATLPYFATKKIGNLTDRDDPLTAAQVRRGAFNNSGSRDAGKDHNWDLKTGTYIYPKGFAEHLKMQDPDDIDLGPDMGPIVQAEKKQRSKQ